MGKQHWYLLIGIFSLFSTQLIGQKFSVQELLLELNRDNQNRVDSIAVLNLLCQKLGENSPDSAVMFGEEAIRIAKLEDPDSLLARAYLMTSIGYSSLGEFETSAKYNFNALAIGERRNDTLILIDGNNNLGIDFFYRNEFLQAKEHFEKVRTLAQAVRDSARLGHALNNLGLIIGSLGDTQGEIPYYLKSKAIFEKIKEGDGEVNAIMNLGTAYYALNRDQEAIEAFESAVLKYDSLHSVVGKSQALMNLSESHLKAGRAAKSTEYALQARDIAVQHNLRTEEAYAYQHLNRVYRLIEDYKQAYNYLEKYQEVSEEIFNSEKSAQIQELSARYEAVKKEQEINLLKVNNQLIKIELSQKKREQAYLIALFGLLAVFCMWAAYQYREKFKLKNSLLTKEIDELRWKINAMVDGVPEGVNITLEQINNQLSAPLTQREFDILLLALSDKSNKKIADETFVSINTVKYHMKNIYEKLGVSSRGEVLQFVIRSS